MHPKKLIGRNITEMWKITNCNTIFINKPVIPVKVDLKHSKLYFPLRLRKVFRYNHQGPFVLLIYSRAYSLRDHSLSDNLLLMLPLSQTEV